MITEKEKSAIHLVSESFKKDEIALVECTHKDTGDRVPAICLVERDDTGTVRMAPVAMLLEGDPTLYLSPPEPEEEGESLCLN